MPLIEVRCPHHGIQERLVGRHPVPHRAECPVCGEPSPRVMSTPSLKKDGEYSYRDRS